jgi:hypothetical protein
MLALTARPARRWEPKRLRLRLWSIATRLIRHAAAPASNSPPTPPWTEVITTGQARLDALSDLTSMKPTTETKGKPPSGALDPDATRPRRHTSQPNAAFTTATHQSEPDQGGTSHACKIEASMPLQ